ncbi:hypothetical protein RB3127 [Rhodopirellula baltica SH 1]|uniref:Uncharacterized protein n=1 Tax=Rhodopirellula baltica (strain DSM 10527 / NCIMB 13988 / SH1) TaxID=243090 RepID=Q7UUR5_RHOBA|nr:hypothetical protein RB3127 [Rhodopirellula baltica SH 1]
MCEAVQHNRAVNQFVAITSPITGRRRKILNFNVVDFAAPVHRMVRHVFNLRSRCHRRIFPAPKLKYGP